MRIIKKSAVTALAAMSLVLGASTVFSPVDVSAANYSSDKGNVTIYEDGRVKVDFTLSKVDDTQVLYGFGICLFEEKPELLSNDKLVNSGQTFYDSDVCKHVYHMELDTPVNEGDYNNTYTITYQPNMTDISGFDGNAQPVARENGMTLLEALQTGKDWHIVVGVHTTFGTQWHTNCDLYLGQISEFNGGGNFVPHDHAWHYEARDNKIYAWCDEQKLSCDYYATSADNATLIDELTADDMTYTGSPYDKASKTDNISDITGATQTEISYYATDASGKKTDGELLNNPPTDVGNYYAVFSIIDGDHTYTAVKSFDIDPLDISVGKCEQDLGDPDSVPETVTITINNVERTLTVGTDCLLEYGDKTVTIIGRGNYTGTLTVDMKSDDSSLILTGGEDDISGTSGDLDDSDDEVSSSINFDDMESDDTDDAVSEDEKAVSEADEDSSVLTVGAINESSPVTGYGAIANVIGMLMMLGIAGMIVSAREIRRKED